jgi:simple sugar transport system permease protein
MTGAVKWGKKEKMAFSFLPVWFIGNAFDAAAVLMTASLGAFIAFGMRLFNFGGEGQIYAGGLAASAVILFVQSRSGHLSGVVPALVLTLAGTASAVAGGILGMAAGFLKKHCNANELLTTFLLSASLIPVCDALVIGFFRDKSGSLLSSEKFISALRLPSLWPPSNLSLSFVLALLLVVLFHAYLRRTGSGYRYFITGNAPEFAAYGGIDGAAYIVPALTVSGALHGLAGFFFCAGTAGALHLGFSGGTGWNAVAIALLAGKKPLLIIPAGVLFCCVLSGANSALLLRGLTLETKTFIEALVLCIAASLHFNASLNFKMKGKNKNDV